MPPPTSGRRTARTLFIIVILVVWGLITHGTYAGSGDEPHYLMIARSVAFDGDIDLANEYADKGNLIGAGDITAGDHARPGKDGTLRPVHDVGLPLVASPLVAVAYSVAQWLGAHVPDGWLQRARLNESLLFRHQMSLFMAMIAGLLAIQLQALMREVEVTPRRAFWWALLVTLSPPLLSMSFLFLTELPAALMIVVALRRILRPTQTAIGWALTGALVGLIGFVHVRNGPLALALAVLATVRHRATPSALVPFAIAIVALASLRTFIHWTFWGTLIFNQHARLGGFAGASQMMSEATLRATGLLFDQEFGLLTFAPIYLLAIPGLVQVWQRRPSLGRPIVWLVICGFATIVLPMLNPYGWVGGWTTAARFLVPIAPLLAVAAAVAAQHAGKWPSRLIAVLVVLQIAIDVVIWNEPKVLWDNGDGINAVTLALPFLRGLFAWLPSWHGPAPSAAPFFVAVLLWGAFTVWMLRSTPVPRAE